MRPRAHRRRQARGAAGRPVLLAGLLAGLLAVLLAGLLAGCSVGPERDPTPLSPPLPLRAARRGRCPNWALPAGTRTTPRSADSSSCREHTAPCGPVPQDNRVPAPPRSARLLLVEDDAHARHALRLVLGDEGYDVLEAVDAASALRALPEADAVLLDLGLPDGDGLHLCRRIRAASDLPIVIVTGRSADGEVVAGLEAGADDYVTKPVVGEVLGARLRAVLRRVRPTLSPVLTVGDLELSVEEGQVRRGGRDVHLTRTEFRLLAELAAHVGHVVTREQLLRRVWGYDYFGDTRLLDVHVRRLRSKIERDPDAPQLVTTVRGLGYRMPRVALDLLDDEDDDGHDEGVLRPLGHQRHEHRDDARRCRTEVGDERREEREQRERQPQRHAEHQQSGADEQRVEQRDDHDAADVAAERSPGRAPARVHPSAGAGAGAGGSAGHRPRPHARPVLEQEEHGERDEERDTEAAQGQRRAGHRAGEGALHPLDHGVAQSVDLGRVQVQRPADQPGAHPVDALRHRLPQVAKAGGDAGVQQQGDAERDRYQQQGAGQRREAGRQAEPAQPPVQRLQQRGREQGRAERDRQQSDAGQQRDDQPEHAGDEQCSGAVGGRALQPARQQVRRRCALLLVRSRRHRRPRPVRAAHRALC